MGEERKMSHIYFIAFNVTERDEFGTDTWSDNICIWLTKAIENPIDITTVQGFIEGHHDLEEDTVRITNYILMRTVPQPKNQRKELQNNEIQIEDSDD